jgi:hypothetical protein
MSLHFEPDGSERLDSCGERQRQISETSYRVRDTRNSENKLWCIFALLTLQNGPFTSTLWERTSCLPSEGLLTNSAVSTISRSSYSRLPYLWVWPHRVERKFNGVSERSASVIIRFHSSISSNAKIQVTAFFYRTTRRHMLQDSNMHGHCCQNITPWILLFLSVLSQSFLSLPPSRFHLFYSPLSSFCYLRIIIFYISIFSFLRP